MPELPEVETVCRGLNQLLSPPVEIEAVQLRRKSLRTPIPGEIKTTLRGQQILRVRRRAKYLLWETSGELNILSHLGMTGSWRMVASPAERGTRLHDHVEIWFRDGRRLIYNDPRRFGFIDLYSKGQEAANSWLKHLGPEPLDRLEFHGDYLWQASRGRRAKIKALLMDQRVVVGVGNIYASEALYRAGVRPGRAAGRISLKEADRIVLAVREVLQEAIQTGGSSIRDFKSALQESGGFQDRLFVYGRAGEPCRLCAQTIAQKVIAGRSSYWCPKCQV